MAAAPAAPRIMVRSIPVPEPTVEAYKRIASSHDHPRPDVDDLMADQLVKTVDWHGHVPIFVDDEHRREIEDMVKTTIRTQDQLVNEVRLAHSLHIAGIKVALTKDILDRLKTRWFDKTMTFEQHLGNVIREHLEVYVGLR